MYRHMELTLTCRAWLMMQGSLYSCSTNAFSSSTVNLVRLRLLSERRRLLEMHTEKEGRKNPQRFSSSLNKITYKINTEKTF